jgi:hypothetical protein
MSSTSNISKGGSDIQTQDGTIHVQPYRQANSKQLRAVISFTPRSSAFEASGSDPFRGFYSLFWISMFLLLLRTYVNNFVQNGYPLSMVFATLFTRDATTLALSDAVLVGSTFICVPFIHAIQKGYIRYYYTGQTILHIYHIVMLSLAIRWTFTREWPWVSDYKLSTDLFLHRTMLGAIRIFHFTHPGHAHEDLFLRGDQRLSGRPLPNLCRNRVPIEDVNGTRWGL